MINKCQFDFLLFRGGRGGEGEYLGIKIEGPRVDAKICLM